MTTTTTTNMIKQTDIADYLMSCNIQDLTRDKIFYGWKQTKKHQEKQFINKYNIAIINDGRERFGIGNEMSYKNVDGELREIHCYRGINNFIIKVFNWYGSLLDGGVKDYYDCEDIFMQILDCFVNKKHVLNLTTLSTDSGYNSNIDLSYIEYGFKFSIYSDITVDKRFKGTFIENVKLNPLLIVK